MVQLTPTASTPREQFWLGHLRKIESAGIATKAYAERRGLSVHALYQARKQLVSLGAWPERKASPARVFTPVRVGSYRKYVSAQPHRTGHQVYA
jgi:hypothetical protein